MKIEHIEKKEIDREFIMDDSNSLVTISGDYFDPSTMFDSSIAAEGARNIFLETSVNEKVMKIAKEFERLSATYSEEAITNVFKSIINMDHQLYSDIITAALFITVKYGDQKYIQFMNNIIDIIHNEDLKAEEEDVESEEVVESISEDEVEESIIGDEEGIK